MDALDAIMTRRSVRKFTADDVSDSEVDVLLHAAMAAPSASNERSWRFVVVRDREKLARLAKATPFAGALAAAPVGIVVAADRKAMKYPGFWVIDCSAAIENMLLAAHAAGLGGVWIGVHPIKPFAWNVSRAVGLPRSVVPHSLVALGHPVSMPGSVDRFEDGWVNLDAWGGVWPARGSSPR